MQRPTSVTVFGVLNIVLAIVGVLAVVASLALLSATASVGNPFLRIMQESPAYTVWFKLSLALGLLAGAVLLISGIGLLMMKRWARVAAIVYAIYTIVSGLLGVFMNFFLLFRPLLEEASRRPGPETAGAVGGAIGGTFGGCIGLVYPVLLIIFMTRPKVVAAFTQSAPPAS